MNIVLFGLFLNVGNYTGWYPCHCFSLLILPKLQNKKSLVVVLIYSEQCHGSDCPCAIISWEPRPLNRLMSLVESNLGKDVISEGVTARL